MILALHLEGDIALSEVKIQGVHQHSACKVITSFKAQYQKVFSRHIQSCIIIVYSDAYSLFSILNIHSTRLLLFLRTNL